MGILDAYQDSTDTALQVMAARPVDPEKPKPKHSAWTVVPRAVAAAGSEIAGNIIDTASAFGQVAAASGGLTPGFDPEQHKNRAASAEAMDRLKTEGIDFRPAESRANYEFAADMRPDPLTAGAAENIVFGLTKGLTKAVGSATLLGNVGGAGVFGLSEGMVQSEDLAAQGVDLKTRTKVGAVSAALNTAGMALPVAGRTLAETAALVAVGGPGSFIAQQELSRTILKDADYGKIADQFDPLDPTGLALATLLPAGFAAFAKAGTRSGTRTGSPETKPAEGGTQSDGFAPTHGDIDAVMTHNLTAAQDARPAMERRELLRAWDEVHQNPIGPANDPLVRLTPDDVAHVLVSRGPVALKEDGVSISVPGYGLVKFIWRHGPQSNKADAHQINAEDLADFPVLMRQYEPTVTSSFSEKTGRTTEQMTWIVDRPDGRRVVYGTTSFLADGEHHLVTVHVDGEMKQAPSMKRKEPPSTSGPDTLQASGRDTARESFASSSREVDGGRTPIIGKGGEDVTPDVYRAKADQLLTEFPDLVARIDESGKPVKFSDELAAIRKAAQEGTDTEFGSVDAPLLKVAAECAIVTGTAAL